jgi:ATP-dependent DNA helicase RecQ
MMIARIRTGYIPGPNKRSATMPDLDDARRTLNDVFGFRTFRKGQRKVIARLLNGTSTLAVFPTGGGKSLCYQLPALLLDGLTIVVSPLIALMKDQVDFLVTRGIAAARLDSSLDPVQVRQVYADLRAGRLKLLYIAPERLASERFVEAITGQSIALLAVDEAHCISEWGHNFRPEYLKLARLAEQLDVGCVLALTATATPDVVQDIARAFGIDDEDVIVRGFHRENLELRATPCRAEDRLGLLLDRLESRPRGSTLVYVTRQDTAETLAETLRSHGYDAVAYHAGLGDERRPEIQDAFMASDTQIVVATIAFGMGIDKAGIRYVYHYNLPKGPENYAQEIGRAGRDGEPAICELFACAEDVMTVENFVYGDTPSTESITGFLTDVLGHGREFDLSVYDLANDHDIRQLVVHTILTYLELEGVLKATGPFYAEYKIQPLDSLKATLTRRGTSTADLQRRVIEQARAGRTWLTLELEQAAEALGRPRSQIAALLADLEIEGLVEIKASGLRQGYRRLGSEPDVQRLSALLTERFAAHEEREVDRVHLMLEFAEAEGCLTRWLLAYFGEVLDGDCGHCDRCLDSCPEPILPTRVRSVGRAEREMLAALRAERHAALATPRQLARFLCGLTSPATSRARLTRHSLFGALAGVPFRNVISMATGRSRRNITPAP